MPYFLFALGALVGSVVTVIVFHVRSRFGTIRIDRTNPGKDVYRIDIVDLDSLPKKRIVVLKVDTNADLSQDLQSVL